MVIAGNDNEIWKALSDPTRRSVLDALRDGPKTTGVLCARYADQLSRFGVMKHLRVLEAAGLVLPREQGREVWNYLNAVPLQRVHERWVSSFQAKASINLLKLEKHLNVQEPESMKEVRIAQEIHYQASSTDVFRGLTVGIGKWWGHSFKKDVTVSLDPRPGGHFKEESKGGGALYATVTYVDPDKKLVLNGPMGMSGCVVGVISFTLEPAGTGTLLKLSHDVIGDVTEETRASYTEGWQVLLGTDLNKYLTL